MGDAFAGGMKEKKMSNVLRTPATTMLMIVRLTVRIYQMRGRDLWHQVKQPRRCVLVPVCGHLADAFFDGRGTDDLSPSRGDGDRVAHRQLEKASTHETK